MRLNKTNGGAQFPADSFVTNCPPLTPPTPVSPMATATNAGFSKPTTTMHTLPEIEVVPPTPILWNWRSDQVDIDIDASIAPEEDGKTVKMAERVPKHGMILCTRRCVCLALGVTFLTLGICLILAVIRGTS